MDNYVGQLVSKLMELELDNNTITIFASDNGAHYDGGHEITFFDSTGGLREKKEHCMKEASDPLLLFDGLVMFLLEWSLN